MLILTPNEWTQIRKKLKEDYAWKPSVFMIRETMRRELGFTTRYHLEWGNETIYLDFYDDAKELWFRMKYL